MARERNDDVPTRPAEHALPAGDAGDAVVAFWEGGYRRLPLIDRGTIDVGRGDECELRIDHPSVSRRHVRLHADGGVEIEDLGSFNGSRLNGSAMAKGERHRLAGGDVVELGNAILIVQRSGPPRASVPPRALEAQPDRGQRAMERLARLTDLVAKNRINVILVGETGAGKEVAARAIHAKSPRSSRNFVCINCAAVPEALLEAELFGFERGAFTGADRRKVGLLEAADGGTFLLDEVGELPLPTQAKLLRVIERREVQRLGSLAPEAADVRFIAATHRDLAALVEQGRFRADLWHRLNGITIAIPPLRERRFQIGELATAFAAAAAAELGQPAPAISADLLALLERHAWPGNVRELKNTIDRAVLLSEGRPLSSEHLEIGQATPQMAADAPMGRNALRRDYAEFERERILAALEQSGGNQTECAKLLGVSRRTLLNRLDALELPRPRKRPR